MTSRYSLLFLFLAVLFVHVLSDGDDDRGDDRKPKPDDSDLSEKGKELLKKGELDKLSKDDRKKIRPKDLGDINLKGAGKKLLKNLTKIIGKGGKDDVEKLGKKLNCSQLHYVLNGTSKWNCEVLRGLGPAVKRCRKAHGMKKNITLANLKPLVRCGIIEDLSKDEVKKLGKDGAFKDASRETKKERGKKAKEIFGEPEGWGKDDLEGMKDFLEDVPLKDRKKIPKDSLKKFLKEGGGKKWGKQSKSDVFRHLFKGKKNLTLENITWVCDAGFEAELRPKDIKHLPKENLTMHVECFGSKRAHKSVRKEFTKRLCSGKMYIDNATAKACVHSLADMKPSDLKNDTVVEKLLEAYLKLPDKKKPKLKGQVCRILAKAFMKKHDKGMPMKGMPKLKAGPLVKCMNRSAMEIFKDKDSLNEIAKSKKNKGLRRKVLDELNKNKTKTIELLLRFVDVMKIDELKTLNSTILGLDDDEDDDDYDNDESLEEDESKGSCDDEEDGEEEDDEEEDDEDSDDDDDDDDDSGKPKFCGKASRFIVFKGINIPYLNVRKIIKITRFLLHGGMTVKNIEDLNDDEFATMVAIFTKRENVFSIRQAAKVVTKYKMLNKTMSDALEDMEGMIAFLNKTDLESILPAECDDVIMKLRGSAFLWRLGRKVRMDLVKLVVTKCVPDVSKMTGEQLVNLGHLITALGSEFDKIPGQLLVDNLDEFRDALEEQMMHKGFGHLIMNITKKIVEQLGGPSALTEDHIAQFGVLRKGLNTDHVKDLTPDVLEELQLYEDDLNPEAAKQLFESRQGKVTTRRKRATTDYAAEDADFFLALGQTILGIPAAEITNIANDVFNDIVGTVSEISGWDDNQLAKWAEKAKAAWGTVNTFTTDELLLLNNFAKGFTAAELAMMDFSSDDVIDSFGAISGFSAAQAQKIFESIKSAQTVSTMTGADLLRLGSIAMGMSADDIKGINTDAFKEAVSQLGGMTGWSDEQLVALKDKAVAAYGATSEWDGAVLSTVNVIIGGFTEAEVKGLGVEDLQYISTEAIEALPPTKFNKLPADLIKELDAEQAQSVTEAQIAVLSDAQKSALATAQSTTVTDGSDGDGGDGGDGGDSTTPKPDDGDGGGSIQTVFGLVSIVLPLLCSQLLI